MWNQIEHISSLDQIKMDEVLRISRRPAKFVYLAAINLIRNEHLDCKCVSCVYIKLLVHMDVYICIVTIDLSMRDYNM